MYYMRTILSECMICKNKGWFDYTGPREADIEAFVDEIADGGCPFRCMDEGHKGFFVVKVVSE